MGCYVGLQSFQVEGSMSFATARFATEKQIHHLPADCVLWCFGYHVDINVMPTKGELWE